MLFIVQVWAIIPPQKGVQPPANFKELKSTIEKDYSTGYYAKKFAARAELAEKVAQGYAPKSALSTDTVFALTLMGVYSDANSTYTVADMQTHLFDGPNPTGTVTEYYKENTYNKMHFTGQCQGWFKVPGTLSSYRGSNNGLGTSGGPQFVLDLVKKADSLIDFSKYIQYYDASNVPHIGFIAAIHTGGDAATGAANIWSHRWNFRMVNNNSAYTTNDTDPKTGKKVVIDGDYALEPEMQGASNTNGLIVDIGVFAHEFGHIFGLPDLYDTDNSSEGLGEWCLMASGAYGGNGSNPNTPTHMSLWCKKKLGWVVPTEITAATPDLKVPKLETNDIGFKIFKLNSSGSKEYYLIENRQAVGYDKYIHTSGLLIYHVDEAMTTNQNENHYLVDLMQADGKRNLNLGQNRGDAGDPYPGSTDNHNFDNSTTPSSVGYTGSTFVSVRNIHPYFDTLIADLDLGTKPYIRAKEFSVGETVTQNGRMEPGEKGSISLKLSNIENMASAQTKVSISFSDPTVQVLIPSKTVAINALDSVVVNITDAFQLPANYQPKMLYCKYEAASEYNVARDSVLLTFGIPKYLVVSKPDKTSLLAYYDTTLKKAGKVYEYVYWNTPRYLSNRKVVFYQTGQIRDTLFTQQEIDSLTSYINHGGSIMFAGQNIAEYLKIKFPNFLTTLGIDWVKNNTVFATKAYGIASDMFGVKDTTIKFTGANGANNEKSTDVISALSGFHMSFAYKADGTDGAAGWMKTANGARIFFMGFGFESINNDESQLSRDQFMGMVLPWLEGTVAVNDVPLKSFGFTMSQNYPNPFNPTTVIEYSIPEKALVTMRVYDILGKEIAVLSNGLQEAGRHVAQFNGSKFASGVYFVHMQAGTYTAVRKMVLAK